MTTMTIKPTMTMIRPSLLFQQCHLVPTSIWKIFLLATIIVAFVRSTAGSEQGHDRWIRMKSDATAMTFTTTTSSSSSSNEMVNSENKIVPNDGGIDGSSSSRRRTAPCTGPSVDDVRAQGRQSVRGSGLRPCRGTGTQGTPDSDPATSDPTESPTTDPTDSPTSDPTDSPTTSTPTSDPTDSPTSPTDSPTESPKSPTDSPTESPFGSPTESPSESPSSTPTGGPGSSPSLPPFVATPATTGSTTPIIAACTGSSTANVKGATSLTNGNIKITIGFQQVSSNNQNPIVFYEDLDDPTNNWCRQDIEQTGADAKGTLLLLDPVNNRLFATFTVDGGSNDESNFFTRFTQNGWLKSYGTGGGPVVTILAELDITTGEPITGTFIIAKLNNGNTNTIRATDIFLTKDNNIRLYMASAFRGLKIDKSLYDEQAGECDDADGNINVNDYTIDFQYIGKTNPFDVPVFTECGELVPLL